MFEINIKVNGNGTLNIGNCDRIKLGTEYEINRVKLVFDIDSSISGTYHYVKFVKKDTAYLFRVRDNELLVSKSVLASAGIWLLSFIATDSVMVNNELTGVYAFISKPVEAVVFEGILSKGQPTEEVDLVKDLISLDFEELHIPDYVEEIGDYFMYNTDKNFGLFIGTGVKTIGSYAFYNNLLGTLIFEEGCQVETFKDNSFYNIYFENDFYVPSTVKNWGKYVLKNSEVICIVFPKDSKIETLGSYALWENSSYEVYLPGQLKTLSGNTYVIKNCKDLYYLWIPNTITTPIPANAIYGCDALEHIELEEGFNVSANFSNCTALTAETMVSMFEALTDLTGQTAKSLTLGLTNLAKLTTAQKAIATNKNWTLS